MLKFYFHSSIKLYHSTSFQLCVVVRPDGRYLFTCSMFCLVVESSDIMIVISNNTKIIHKSISKLRLYLQTQYGFRTYTELTNKLQPITWFLCNVLKISFADHSSWKHQLLSQEAAFSPNQTNNEACEKPKPALPNGKFKLSQSLFCPLLLCLMSPDHQQLR